jgi:hypothetical protein
VAVDTATHATNAKPVRHITGQGTRQRQRNCVSVKTQGNSTMMTRKDFQRVARVFRVSLANRTDHHNWPNTEWYKDKLWNEMLANMCIELKAINPRFDEDQFREACNGKSK